MRQKERGKKELETNTNSILARKSYKKRFVRISRFIG